MLTSGSRSPSAKTRKKAPRPPSTRNAGSSRPRAAKAAAPKPRKPAILSTRQRAFLRGLGHHLQPVVMLGKEGITAGLLQALDIALDQHELVKLRVLETAPSDAKELAADLASQSVSALVQVLGRTLLLYRRRPDSQRSARPAIELPKHPA